MGPITPLILISFMITSLLAVPLTSNGNDEPISFFRSAVESNPFDRDGFSTKLDYKTLLEEMLEKEESLPLRTAVEDIPYTTTQRRLPLRDAVEHSLIDDDNVDEGFSRLRLDTRSGFPRAYNPRRARSSSYWDPNPFSYVRSPLITPIDSIPPYRAAPYQQIVHGPAYFVAPSIDDFDFETRLYHDPETAIAEYEDAEAMDYGGSDGVAVQSEKLKASSKDYQVFCHFTNWAFYRFGDGKFVPENLDPSLCSYIIFSFASLDPQSLTMKEFDPWGDIENRESHFCAFLSLYPS